LLQESFRSTPIAGFPNQKTPWNVFFAQPFSENDRLLHFLQSKKAMFSQNSSLQTGHMHEIHEYKLHASSLLISACFSQDKSGTRSEERRVGREGRCG